MGFVALLLNAIDVKNRKLKIPDSKLFKLTGLLILTGIVYLIFSWVSKTNVYFYLRNSVIVYSMFAFYFGYFAFPYLHSFLKKIRIALGAYLLYALINPSIFLLERFMGAAFFPFLFKRYNKTAAIGIVVLSTILANRYESLTVIVVTLMVVGLFLIPSYKAFKIFAISAFLTLVTTFCYLAPSLEEYKTPAYKLFGNISAVRDSHFLLDLDENSTWRAVFWYRVVKERFPENLVGIGFGTPMLPYYKDLDTVPVPYDDKHDIHVSGAHNTYLTLFLRMGIPFIILISLIFREVFKVFYSNKKKIFDRVDSMFFYSFFTIAAVGFFNLVLESPIAASLFWGMLGVVACSIQSLNQLTLSSEVDISTKSSTS